MPDRLTPKHCAERHYQLSVYCGVCRKDRKIDLIDLAERKGYEADITAMRFQCRTCKGPGSPAIVGTGHATGVIWSENR
jgi:hypothetical protein